MSAALKVFAEKGFAEASNKDVADEARLGSPGLIYHYFPSKLELLRAIIESKSPLGEILEDVDWLLAQPPDIALRKIARIYASVHQTDDHRRLMKVVLGEALRNAEFAATFAEIAPLRILGLLTKYFDSQMTLGRFKKMDPLTAARAFVGPFVTLLVFRTVFDQSDQFPIDFEQVVEDNVQIFLHGIEVQNT